MPKLVKEWRKVSTILLYLYLIWNYQLLTMPCRRVRTNGPSSPGKEGRVMAWGLEMSRFCQRMYKSVSIYTIFENSTNGESRMLPTSKLPATASIEFPLPSILTRAPPYRGAHPQLCGVSSRRGEVKNWRRTLLACPRYSISPYTVCTHYPAFIAARSDRDATLVSRDSPPSLLAPKASRIRLAKPVGPGI